MNQAMERLFDQMAKQIESDTQWLTRNQQDAMTLKLDALRREFKRQYEGA